MRKRNSMNINRQKQQVHQYQTKKVEVMERRKDEILLRKTGSIHRDTTKGKVLRR